MFAGGDPEADEFVRRWIERDDSWDHSIPRTLEEAKTVAATQLAVFENLLDIAGQSGTDVLRVIPDTNALLRNPDLASYARSLPSTEYVVHLLPTVLGELDELKDRGKTQDLRDQAQGVVRRLKGLRDKGSLAAGVKLTKTVTVRTEAREVDVPSVLDWLDPAVPDDRIVAASLRLQSDHPSGVVVLVTSDLNLQNKADAVGLPYVETPPTLASLRAKLEASIRWPSDREDGRPPLVTLLNNGPAVARTIGYSVETPAEATPPKFTAGPWNIERLVPGGSDDREFWGAFPATVNVVASWTDDDGHHNETWPVEFPSKPTRAPHRQARR